MKSLNRIKYIILTLLVFSNIIFGQDENLKYYDYTYKSNIKSVKFFLDGIVLSDPIVELNSDAILVLSFDDLDADLKNYVYSFVHCNANWEPSSITEMEYLNGFSEGDIDEHEYSFNTYQDYTHYWLALPNDDMQWILSGNYLLKVYDDEDERELAITKRFIVTEQRFIIDEKISRAAKVEYLTTHQEVDFVVKHRDFEISSPQIEISATVIQNWMWTNAIYGIKPLFNRNEAMYFDYQNKLVFPGGKEFRQLDLRSFEYKMGSVNILEDTGDGYEIILFKDRKRNADSYSNIGDINGKFVIENSEENFPDTEGDYGNVFFSLYSPTKYFDYDVYLFGEISDWQIKDEFEMVYNERINAYVSKLFLKEGFYNYYYALVPAGTKETPSFDETEGNWFETENDYTIIVYYRPFGSRYDRVVAVQAISSKF